MNIVIIGNHAAGLSAVQALRKAGASDPITVLSDENVPPYSRCLIPYLISGDKQVQDILFLRPDFYQTHRVDARLGTRVVKVLPKENKVLLADGTGVTYGALIIATGGTPSFPAIPGIKMPGVFGCRTLADAERIRAYCDKAETVAVIGGGLVGIKAAAGLFDRGKKIKIVVGSPNVLSQTLCAHEAQILERYLNDLGMEIITRTNPTRVVGKEGVEALETTEGRRIDCQMVIVGKGVTPNTEIVADTDIATEYGIVVDDHCRTNVPNVYAAGDVAQSLDSVRQEKSLNALWPLAVEEGRVAAENVLGRPTSLKGRTSMNSLKIGELAVISCGLTGAREQVEGAEEIAVRGPGPLDARRFIIKDDRLMGFALVGNVAQAGVLTSLVTRQINIESIKDRLVSGTFDFAAIVPLIRANRDRFTGPEYEEALGLN